MSKDSSKKKQETGNRKQDKVPNSQFLVPNPTREASFGGPVRIILSAFAIFLISQFIAVFVLEIIYGIVQPGSKNILDQSTIAQLFYVLLAEGLAVASILLVLRRRKLNLSAIGLGRRPAWSDLKWAVAGFVAFYGLLIVAMVILTALIPSFDTNAPQDVGFNFLSTPLDRLIAFIALVIIPPIGEETLMRGYLYSGLRSRLKFWPALLVTSLLFGAAHLSTGVNGALWAAGVDTFFLSVVLVFIRERTNALYAPMLVHSLNNLVAFFAHFHG